MVVVECYRKYPQKNAIWERHIGIYDRAGS